MSNISDIDKNMDDVRVTSSENGVEILANGSNSFRVFDSSYNVSQILKFIPFYERLSLRIVNSRWNLSFLFPGCWETLDFRFFDFTKNHFYLTNFLRFISSIKSLDICIDQLFYFNGIIRSSLNANTNFECVDFKRRSSIDEISNWSCETSDIIDLNLIESPTDSNYDDVLESFDNLLSEIPLDSDESSPVSDQNDYTDPILDSLNNVANGSMEIDTEYFNESVYLTNPKGPDEIRNELDDLMETLGYLTNLKYLQISNRLNRDNTIFSRINPVIQSHIDTFKISSSDDTSSDTLTNNVLQNSHLDVNLDSNIDTETPEMLKEIPPSLNPKLTTLIIDSYINSNLLLGLIPYVKDVRNLVISRVYDTFERSQRNLNNNLESRLGICTILSELLLYIRSNQLESVQFGISPCISSNSSSSANDFLQGFQSLDHIKVVKEKSKKRINLCYKLFENYEFYEGDEILLILLLKQYKTLEILIVNDINVSNKLYNFVTSYFRKLRYISVPVWNNLLFGYGYTH